MIDDGDRPRPAPDVEIDVLDGEAVVFHLATLQILHLNRSAALIWHLCNGRRTVAEICSVLADAYPDEATQIALDVARTVRVLQEKGALVVASKEAGDSVIR